MEKKNGLLTTALWSKTLEKMGVKSVVKEDVVIPVVSGPIDLSKLKGHIPDAVLLQIPDVMEKFKINTL